MDFEYSSILNKLGPCGLNCSKCFAFSEGSIKKLSTELKDSLGNFDVYAARFTKLLNEPVFSCYPEFKKMLHHFSSVECKGCRKESCKLFTDCNVRECSKKHQVDFCFECNEFPCNQHGFDTHLEKRWLSIQNKMKNEGVVAYFNEVKGISRY